MRVALIKQLLDVQGPWSGMPWKDTTPMGLFEIWPGKLSYWDETCLLKADWYIVPQQFNSAYTQDAVFRHSGREEMVKRLTKNVTVPADIPFEEYDLVITLDPIMDVPKDSSTLFAYHGVEHWDQPYIQSLRAPLGNYDLFLAHMMDSNDELTGLPQAISFPYIHDPDLVRSLFLVPKEEVAWVDWRTLTTLGMTEVWGSQNTAAVSRLEKVVGVPVRYKGNSGLSFYSITDPPTWGDVALTYLQDLAPCKYYIAVGRIHGAGQGAVDAAALNCICIGQGDKAYHRLLCHPRALCADMSELPKRARAILASSDLQAEILAWQEQALREQFVKKPLGILTDALDIKRRRINRRDGASTRKNLESVAGAAAK